MKSRLETAVIVVFLALVSLYGFRVMTNYMKQTEANNEVLRQYLVKNDSKVVLLRIVHEKMPNLPIETQVKVTDTIYTLSNLRQVPVDLICGLIEIESGWNEKNVSEANAKGLMQVLPSTARPYIRAEKLNYSEDILFDPTVNIIIGVSYLADLQEGHVEAGKVKKDDYIYSLHSYFWGGEATKKLYGVKDVRTDVPNLAYPQRVLAAARKYKELGL